MNMNIVYLKLKQIYNSSVGSIFTYISRTHTNVLNLSELKVQVSFSEYLLAGVWLSDCFLCVRLSSKEDNKVKMNF